MLHLLAGVLRAQQGTVRVAGQDLDALSAGRARSLSRPQHRHRFAAPAPDGEPERSRKPAARAVLRRARAGSRARRRSAGRPRHRGQGERVSARVEPRPGAAGRSRSRRAQSPGVDTRRRADLESRRRQLRASVRAVASGRRSAAMRRCTIATHDGRLKTRVERQLDAAHDA